MYDAGDQDNGDVDDLTAAAAGAGTRPSCKHIRLTKRVFGQGGGHLYFRYCWNRTKHKVSLDSQYDNRVSAWVSPATTILGFGTVNAGGERFMPEVLWLNGYWRGALDAHAQFKFRGEVGGGPRQSARTSRRSTGESWRATTEATAPTTPTTARRPAVSSPDRAVAARDESAFTRSVICWSAGGLRVLGPVFASGQSGLRVA